MTADEREAAIRELFPLVRTCARRLANLLAVTDLDDLVGDGAIGLIRAVDSFDPARGVPLPHFARAVIVGAMLNGIRRNDGVSERVRRTVRYAERLRWELAHRDGAMPTERDLERQVPGLAAARAKAYAHAPLSLDATLPERERLAIRRDDDPQERATAAADAETIARAVGALPARQRSVVLGHYYGEVSLRTLSGTLRLSPQRVSQLHLAALRTLRTTLGSVAVAG
jgi:RNA polymerase sigma factor for flagellar operon FliA